MLGLFLPAFLIFRKQVSAPLLVYPILSLAIGTVAMLLLWLVSNGERSLILTWMVFGGLFGVLPGYIFGRLIGHRQTHP